MPRATRASKLFPIALSLSAACDALGVSRAALRQAVYVEATLAAYIGPNRSVRILFRIYTTGCGENGRVRHC